MGRAKKRKNLSSARHYDQIRSRNGHRQANFACDVQQDVLVVGGNGSGLRSGRATVTIPIVSRVVVIQLAAASSITCCGR